MSQQRQTLKWIRFAIGLGILFLVLYYVDVSKLRSTLTSLSPSYLLLMLLTAFFGRLLRAWKWNVLLRTQGVRISTWQALRMSFIAHFTGAWTPGQIGGDAYRVYALREFNKTKEILSTVLLERYAGLCGVCLFVLLGLPVTLPYLARTSPWLTPVLLGIVLIVMVVLPSLLLPSITTRISKALPRFENSKIGAKLTELHGTFLEYRNHRIAIASFSIITLLEITSYFILNYLCARALGLNVTLVFFFFAMPIVHLALRIPISVQALGIQEGCFVVSLLVFGFPAAEARASGVALSLVQRALEWFVSIAPGGILLWLTEGPRITEAMGEEKVADSMDVR